MSKHHKLSGNVHRKIWKKHNGDIPKGYHIHHIDGNPYNNDITNLICLPPSEHAEIHKNSFTKWASIGGKMGGEKCKEQKIGWFSATPEERKQRSEKAVKSRNTAVFSQLRYEEYKSGKRKHWTKFYTQEQVSEMISKGDPGKSTRGKKAWNKDKKMILKDPEKAKANKSIAALNRKKFMCECCGKEFDAGNLKKHVKAKSK